MAMVSFSSVSSLMLWLLCYDLHGTLSRSNLDCGGRDFVQRYSIEVFQCFDWSLVDVLCLHNQQSWYCTSFLEYSAMESRISFSIHLSGIFMFQRQRESFSRTRVNVLAHCGDRCGCQYGAWCGSNAGGALQQKCYTHRHTGNAWVNMWSIARSTGCIGVVISVLSTNTTITRPSYTTWWTWSTYFEVQFNACIVWG